MVTVGYKGIFLFFSLICATLLSGCVSNSEGGTDVTALASSLPQVKEFLDQYPNAKVSVALWDSASVEKNVASIRADCGEQFAVADYYKVSVTDPSFSLVVWLDKSGQNVMCAVKGATPASSTVIPTVQPAGSTTVPAASSTEVPSESMPPLPPEANVNSSQELPPLPPTATNESGLTYEEYMCTNSGGHWDACASPCEGREGAMCAQVCVAKCVYPNATKTPTPSACVEAGRVAYNYSGAPTCCVGLILNNSAVSATSISVLGYCTYPVPPVAPNCSWVTIGCSYYGAYWSGKPIECNAANEGKVGMGPSNVLGGAYVPESYTSEHWNTCFTPRAKCSCGNVAIPTPSPTATANCVDTDGGKNYYAQGNTTMGNMGAAYDCCTSGTDNGVCIQSGPAVYEGYCSNNLLGSLLYACPNGCANGACINATSTPIPSTSPTPTCVDEDGGINYYVAGNTLIGVTGTHDCCEGVDPQHPYWCLTNGTGTTLVETFCNANNTLGSVRVTCPNGCVNSVCVNATVIPSPSPSPSPSPTPCAASDGVVFGDVWAVNVWGTGVSGAMVYLYDSSMQLLRTLNTSQTQYSAGTRFEFGNLTVGQLYYLKATHASYVNDSYVSVVASSLCGVTTYSPIVMQPAGVPSPSPIPSPSPSTIPSPTANYTCTWTSIECSHYPGVMTSPLVASWCNTTNLGQIAMVGNDGLHQQQYVSTYMSACMTTRVQCSCSGSYSAPSSGTGFVVSNPHPWWCFWCN